MTIKSERTSKASAPTATTEIENDGDSVEKDTVVKPHKKKKSLCTRRRY
jgi:hypothetical protein